MTVSAEDVRIIAASLPLVRDHLEPASERFYDNLFALAPELRGLFRDDLTGQGMRFMSTLATIAELLGDPPALEAELAGLARAHAQLGVRSEHFAPMGSALIATLAETLGDDFTPQTQAAWRRAFEDIADQMIARGGFPSVSDTEPKRG